MMFPSRTSENPTLSQFPQYLNISSFGTTTDYQSLVATHQKTESPNLFITDNMNYYYADPLVKNCHSVVLPSRIVQPAVGKKNRHCKIVTARGPRDRRMRLSIDIAKKFFGLQDMLGFDKASKTLDWLLTKSKPAIEELAQKKILAESVEVIKSNNNGDLLQAEKLARESRRAKARARARERTRMKSSISTTIKVDVEMGRQFCNNDEQLSHGDMLLPCSSTENAMDLSSLVASMNTTNHGQILGR